MASDHRRGKRQTREHEPTNPSLSKVSRLQTFQDVTVKVSEHSAVSCRNETENEMDCGPLEVSVAQYAESHARELQGLAQAVDQVGGTKLSFQRLPRHMRRRAMSHNIHRIPRRLRQKALAELEKREKGANKRPSRRHRRRPSNLLSEYQRRQQQNMWLETHIWHAKRFKMTTAWGYRLPAHPNDKSLRACYRASTYFSLLQDVSYECCIQLGGPRQTILEAVNHLTSKDTGLTLAAKGTSTGQRWGSTMMYACDAYPLGAVALVTYLWQPHIENRDERSIEKKAAEKEEESRLLWLWCHPASYAELWHQLRSACALLCTTSSSCLPTSVCEGIDNTDKSINPNFHHGTCSSPQGGTEIEMGQLKLKSLKDELIKFRLTGPASNLILSKTLKLANVDTVEQELVTNTSSSSECTGTHWWEKYYAAEDGKKEMLAQTSCWERVGKCQSPDELPPQAVIALTVRDPRIMLPSVRTKTALHETDSSSEVVTWSQLPTAASVSPLLDEEVRQEVTKTKMTEQEMNRLRSQLIVPGSILELGAEESRIPVLLLQRPGNQSAGCRKHMRSGVGSGWDFIAPKGWAMAFWVAMVYRGARVGGLRESRSLAARSVQLHFPFDFPDTAANHRQEQDSRHERLNKYVRRPPAKRINFKKLGVPTPFHCPWAQLVAEWKEKAQETLVSDTNSVLESLPTAKVDTVEKIVRTEEPQLKEPNRLHADKKTASSYPQTYVLRCRQLLCVLQRSLKPAAHKQNHHSDTNNSRLSSLLNEPLHKTLVLEHAGSLVAVAVSSYMRGIPGELGMICLPSIADLEQLENNSSFGGPVEHQHAVYTVNKNKTKKAKTPVKSSSQARKDDDKSKTYKTVNEGRKKGKNINKDALSAKQVEEKEEWMTEPSRVVSVTDRPVIGFLTNGDFDLGQGCGAGIGFCSLVGLMAAFKNSVLNKPLIVLVRNPVSKQYRFANLSVA